MRANLAACEQGGVTHSHACNDTLSPCAKTTCPRALSRAHHTMLSSNCLLRGPPACMQTCPARAAVPPPHPSGGNNSKKRPPRPVRVLRSPAGTRAHQQDNKNRGRRSKLGRSGTRTRAADVQCPQQQPHTGARASVHIQHSTSSLRQHGRVAGAIGWCACAVRVCVCGGGGGGGAGMQRVNQCNSHVCVGECAETPRQHPQNMADRATTGAHETCA
jgi:hypothetical protein